MHRALAIALATVLVPVAVHAQTMANPGTATIAQTKPLDFCIDKVSVTSMSASPFTQVNGNITINMYVKSSALSALNVPWVMRLDGAAWKSGTVSVAAGATTSVVASWPIANWKSHTVDGVIDPDKTLSECPANNSGSVIIGNKVTLQSVTATPTSFVGGSYQQVDYTFTLSGPFVGTDLYRVNLLLTPSDSFATTVPEWIGISPNLSTAKLTYYATKVVGSPTAVTMAGTDPTGAFKKTTVTSNNYVITDVSFTPASGTTQGGTAVYLTPKVTLNAKAPSGVLWLAVTSSHPEVFASRSWPVNQGESFGVTSYPIPRVQTDTPVTFTIGGGNVPARTATYVVKAATLDRLELIEFNNSTAPRSNTLTLLGGKRLVIAAYLNGGLPGPTAVQLTSSDPVFLPLPATIDLPAATGNQFAYVDTLSVTSPRTVTITGTHGSVSKTGTLTVVPNGLSSFSMTDSAEVGSNVQLGMSLLGVAGLGGMTFPATSSHPSVLPVPASYTINQGIGGLITHVTAGNVTAPTAVTVTVGEGAAAKSDTITIRPVPPPFVMTLTLNPQDVTGGTRVYGSLTLNKAAPAGGFNVPLTSNIAAASVPSSLFIAQGGTTATFEVTTTAVTAEIRGTITAGTGAEAKTRDVLLRP